jgi:PilZ domain
MTLETPRPPDPAVGGVLVERRAHRRVPLAARVQVGGSSGTGDGVARDISVGGLGFRSSHMLEAGDAVRVRLELPGGADVEASGEIVRAEGGDVGLRFTALGQGALLAILAHVGRH